MTPESVTSNGRDSSNHVAQAARDGTDMSLKIQELNLEPFVRLGVVGHIDLKEPNELTPRVTAALCMLLTSIERSKPRIGLSRWRSPTTSRVAYRIISPLAEGADRVVAKLAFSPDERLRDRSRELYAPLPFRRELYRSTDQQNGGSCKDLKSQEEFDCLLRHSRWEEVYPDVPHDKSQRHAWYRGTGEYCP